MLPKKNRISRKFITDLFKSGRNINSKNIFLKYKLTKTFNYPRISFISPKSVARKSYQRNLLRRIGYIAMESHIKKLPNNFLGVFTFKTTNFLVYSKKRVDKSKSILSLERELEECLNKV